MTSGSIDSEPPPSVRPRISGRYRVDAGLGEGGMGVVSRVHDVSTNRTIALKQLRAASGRTGAALFRREYHTLVLLKHPRIIEVYDYGIDDDAPYYTMELLDGEDLRTLAPLGYREACRFLRDVASALSLLAAHRLVHRDLTARNVRVTRDGRCKLIDFGALSPFGMADTVVGTPPYVPPEALRGLPLDQRSDLFALGALAYYLLTRSHAFPARQLSELEAAWARRPERPSARVARLIDDGGELSPLPEALDELVLSLLSLDPAARPQSAAEAIERLCAAAGLEQEPGTLAAESYLLSAALVGREAELSQATALVTRAVSGSGGALSLRHSPGAGGTRLLTEIALEARLAGATVLQVDGELCRGPYAVVRALAEKLTVALPVEAKAAAPPELHSAGFVGARKSERPSNQPSQDPMSAPLAERLRLQAALEEWLLNVATARPLAILVDNADNIDEASATLLSLLSGAAKEHALVVVTAFRDGDTGSSPALQRLERGGTVLALGPLSEADTGRFVQSLFGNAPNAERLTHWLHDLSNGNPLTLMELSEYLVNQGIARYTDGAWALPRELPMDLPSRPEEAHERRLAGLGAKAVELATGLAFYRGRISLDLCVAFAGGDHDDAFVALDELTSAGVLTGHEGGYRFTHKATREWLLARVDATEQRRFHLAVARYLLAEPDPDLAANTDAGFHLLSAGETRSGAELLRKVGLEIVQTDELPAAIPALEAAVTVYRKLDRPRSELCGLLHSLAFGGYYVERRLGDQYGDEALALLAEETGLALTVRLRPYLGAYLALMVGLFYALILHLFGGRGGPKGLNNLISIMGGLVTSLVGASVICLDTPNAARRATLFAPFEPLGLRHAGAFNSAVAKALVGVTEDRAGATIAVMKGLLTRLDARFGVMGFPDRMRPIMRGGMLYALGALEGFMDEPVALERADQLEACGLRLYDMVACQIRANYHANQGNIALAREYEQRVELHATRNGSAWQAEVWLPSSRIVTYVRTRDLIGLKRTADELGRLAQEIPSLGRHARMAEATLITLRGDHAKAIPVLEALCTETAPRAFIGWSILCSVLAGAYNATGQYARAAALCRDVSRGLTDDDRRVVGLTLNVDLELSLAEARLGRSSEAAARLDALLRKHEPNRAPVTLGALHRARAEVAAASGEEDVAGYHRARMEHFFRMTKNPSLIAECERLRAASEPALTAPGRRAGEEPETVLERGSGQRDVSSQPANTEVDEAAPERTGRPSAPPAADRH